MPAQRCGTSRSGTSDDGRRAIPRETLSYASINWIRFKGRHAALTSKRPLASQPPAGAPLVTRKVVLVLGAVNARNAGDRAHGACETARMASWQIWALSSAVFA